MIGADGREESVYVESRRVSKAMERAHSTEWPRMVPPSPKRRRPYWLITLLIVVACGWAWLPLGFVLACAWLGIFVATHLAATIIKTTWDEGCETDGATSDDT